MANKRVSELQDVNLPVVGTDNLLISRDGYTLSKVNANSLTTITNQLVVPPIGFDWVSYGFNITRTINGFVTDFVPSSNIPTPNGPTVL